MIGTSEAQGPHITLKFLVTIRGPCHAAPGAVCYVWYLTLAADAIRLAQLHLAPSILPVAKFFYIGIRCPSNLASKRFWNSAKILRYDPRMTS